MKIQTLFDLMGCTQDVLVHFENVASPPQLISRLERLKRQNPEDLLDDVLALQAALDAALSANIELGGSLSSDDDSSDDVEGGTNDNDMDAILASFDVPETQSPSSQTVDMPTPGEPIKMTSQDAPGNQPTTTPAGNEQIPSS